MLEQVGWRSPKTGNLLRPGPTSQKDWAADGYQPVYVLREDTTEEFKCPHGFVFARRHPDGSYSGKPPESGCSACFVEARRGRVSPE